MSADNSGMAFPSAEAQLHHYGLTKRELFAAVALHGLLTGSLRPSRGTSTKDFSEHSVAHADALIEALKEGKADGG